MNKYTIQGTITLANTSSEIARLIINTSTHHENLAQVTDGNTVTLNGATITNPAPAFKKIVEILNENNPQGIASLNINVMRNGSLTDIFKYSLIAGELIESKSTIIADLSYARIV